jgi:hypothetical protein
LKSVNRHAELFLLLGAQKMVRQQRTVFDLAAHGPDPSGIGSAGLADGRLQLAVLGPASRDEILDILKGASGRMTKPGGKA